MERSQVLATIDAYVDALNAHDVESVLAVFADDATHIEPVGGPVRSGESLRAFLEDATKPGWSCSLHSPPTVVGVHAAFVLAITLEGDTPLTLLSTDVIEVDSDGRIAAFVAYPDWEAQV